ncbi:tyrosine kinase receptor Cad96Ca-like isoform X2 [Glandiceps talaboti]
MVFDIICNAFYLVYSKIRRSRRDSGTSSHSGLAMRSRTYSYEEISSTGDNSYLEPETNREEERHSNQYQVPECVDKSKTEYLNPGVKVFEVERRQVHFLDVIYSGDLHNITKGQGWFIGGKDGLYDVALKTPTYDNPGVSEMILREIELMRSLKGHENVIKMLGCLTKEIDTPCLILELAPHGNVRDFLIRQREQITSNSRISSKLERQIVSFCLDVSNGMNYLSRNKITHRYLAAKHILLCDDMTCKISNLSYSTCVSNANRFYDMAVKEKIPYQWMSLESITKWIFNLKSEVWSFGVVVWELVSLGRTPFQHLTQALVVARIRKGYRLEKPLQCSEEMYDIMLRCWREYPSERPTFSALVKDISLINKANT